MTHTWIAIVTLMLYNTQHNKHKFYYTKRKGAHPCKKTRKKKGGTLLLFHTNLTRITMHANKRVFIMHSQAPLQRCETKRVLIEA
jgi:hypothetical protein